MSRPIMPSVHDASPWQARNPERKTRKPERYPHRYRIVAFDPFGRCFAAGLGNFGKTLFAIEPLEDVMTFCGDRTQSLVVEFPRGFQKTRKMRPSILVAHRLAPGCLVQDFRGSLGRRQKRSKD